MKERYKSYEKRKGHLDWVTLRLRTEQELARGGVSATNSYQDKGHSVRA